MLNVYQFLSRTLLAFYLLNSSVVHADVMLGAYLDTDGWNANHLTKFNTQAGKSMAIVNIFANMDKDWMTLATPVTNILASNAVPMLTWMPTTAARPKDNILVEISQGQWNAKIDDAINKVQAWHAMYPDGNFPTLLLRFGHEFNGKWYPWGNSPTQYVAAWQHIHQRFAAAGVKGVEWVWCANNVSVDDFNNIALYYPGNDMVDWTSLDGYNWGSNYEWSRWSSFTELFSAGYTELVTQWPNKPVMIAEVATAEPHDLPNPVWEQFGNDSDAHESKELWVQDMLTRIPTDFPAIRAVLWTNYNKELGWALNGAGNTGGLAYIAGISKKNYTSQFQPVSIVTHTMAQTIKKKPKAMDFVGRNILQQQAAGIRSLSPSGLAVLRHDH